MQLNINDILLKRAQQVSGLQSAQAVIEAALRVFDCSNGIKVHPKPEVRKIL